MIVRAALVLTLAASFVTFYSPDTIAQSEFLRYQETGLGISVSYAQGNKTERAYEAAATLSFEGALDLTGAAGWTWIEDGPAEGHDVRAYTFGIAYHPLKPNHDYGVQIRLAAGYSSLRLQGVGFSHGFAPDDSRTAAFAEGGVYLAADHNTRVALVPLLMVGRTFANSGDAKTYFSPQMAFCYRKGNGVASLRVGITTDSEETLLFSSLELLGSVGQGWKQ